MKPKFILYIIIGILFTAGISTISLTEIFSENWFIGLGLIAVALAMIIISILVKMRN